MCGIAGYVNRASSMISSQQLLRRMISCLRHRGPDASEIYCDSRAGLAHARLSIIGLTSGAQPMSSADGSLCVSFNGEIFNYIELQDELEKRGHRFRTDSDTEVILHMYQEKGLEFVQSFNGDFAFALWDMKREVMLLARDRMGVRPLYYTIVDGTLYFASEIKALFEVPGVRRELDELALEQCFTFWFPLAPRTMFKGIFELPPGHLLISRGGDVSVRPYWKLNYPTHEEERSSTVDSNELAEELAELLTDATRLRLRADVPVGAYLSGGLDSSIIAALVREIAPTRLCTFSVAFDDPEFDEQSHQQAMVQALGTEHRTVYCGAEDIALSFPQVIKHTERPILRTGPAPMMQLSRLARDSGFKVVLTGEGADELFGGYDIFKEAKIRRYWARQPGSPKRRAALRQLYPYLASFAGQPQAYLEAFFQNGLDHAEDPLFSHLPRWNMTGKIRTFFSGDFRRRIGKYDAIAELREQLPENFGAWHPLSRAQYLEAAHLLPGYLLSSQGDRVAMANSVEGRYPFLDHRLVEFAARIPARLKMKGITEKHLLRKSLARHLPEGIAKRTKQPYRAPDAKCFLKNDSLDYVNDMLSTRSISQNGYFDGAAVAKLVAKCRRDGAIGQRENMALVGILSVQLMHHVFIEAAETPPSFERRNICRV